MPTITLPDGSQKQFEHPVTVGEVVSSIGEGLARVALAGKIDDKLVDLSHAIDHDANLLIITERDPEGLEIIRHSTAHLLAQAVKRLYPEAQVTIGPVIDNGFFYDFAFERGFTPEDLEKIEAMMKQLAKEDFIVTRKVLPRDEAIAYFKNLGENYKAEIIAEIPEGEEVSLYTQGEFTDLCRGPHVPNTRRLKAFKLTKLAGAYWRGDAKNEMLQRIYGTAWAKKDELKSYLERIAEAEKRDHRKIAKAMDLFHLQEEAPGMVFWHDNGWRLYQVIEQYMRRKQREHGYDEIKTPQLADRSLWEKSGHWEMYGEHMFTTESEHRTFAVKPMSCPFHVQVFNHGLRSYRDLPLRFAEFGNCHRNEFSGTLHGLMRVRNFVQDDGHIFCTEEQIQDEASRFIRFLYEVYQDFGFTDVSVKLSTRPDKKVGTDDLWNKAEKSLSMALDHSGLDWEEMPGEGAFYGPKIDFFLRDCLERVWQLGTLQLDYCLPERLGAQYVAEDSSRRIPVMLHRAIFGSFERFIGVLIEHYAGHFPVWLAPWQVVVMNITDKQEEYARKTTETLKNLGFRAKMDLRNEKIGFKIREHSLMHIPYLIVIGDREVQDQTVAVRTQAGEDHGSISLDAFCELLK